ncbi:DMT family transporter [Streptomyces sp. NPDC021080]|uniref:DMT family transporter n=1 Tax=Streptomyces sp. NPDC021080 TaxID=3365110 RepID=UPI0037B2263C
MLRGATWWVSLSLNLVGAALHTAALGFGSLVAVQMLGVLTLVAAPVLSAVVLRGKVSAAQCSGIALTVTGVAGLLLVTRSAPAGRPLGASQVAGVAVLTVALLVAAVAGAALARRTMTAGLWYATAAGVAFGAASALTQTAVLELSQGGVSRLRASAVLLTAGVVLLATTGLVLCQLAYRGSLEAPLATMTLVNPVFAAVVGVVVLGDRYSGGVQGALVGAVAAVAAGRGVFVLAHARSEHDPGTARFRLPRPRVPSWPGAVRGPQFRRSGGESHGTGGGFVPGPAGRAVPDASSALGDPVEVDLDGGREPLDEFLEVE